MATQLDITENKIRCHILMLRIQIFIILVIFLVVDYELCYGWQGINRFTSSEERGTIVGKEEENIVSREDKYLDTFAIFLTKNDIPPRDLGKYQLSEILLEEKPLITIDDILEYNIGNHTMTLTKGAYTRITELEVPLRGRTFVVIVNKLPIYAGAFWAIVSSIPFDGVIIWKPTILDEPQKIKFDFVCPSKKCEKMVDPRTDYRIMEVLKRE